ncbi:hypothetical protein [Jiella mangrovi]|uniref:Uncharacterized protein n=1 Tax=Jiella mangrovi TaxID=2821407 RepID=A0ABS4BK83_9HYPH|nr:hypothetical protein [Jiella mangrovi]MBP0616414.1 hypothetical protein [Jiella mangrovi]
MLKSKRGNFYSAIGYLSASLLIFLFLAVVWNVSSETTRVRVENEAAAKQYLEDTEKKVRAACVITDTIAFTKCAIEQIKASREDQRAEQELIAQTGMNRWAYYMLWVGVASAAITALGAWWVRETLIATRDMNKIARAAIGYDSRAWLRLQAQHVRFSRLPDRLLIVWGASIENIGKSAATDIHIFTRVLVYPIERNRSQDAAIRKSERVRNGRAMALFPQERLHNRLCPADSPVPAEPSIYQIVGTIEYRLTSDGPGDPAHVTEITFDVAFGEFRNVYGDDLLDESGGIHATLTQSSEGRVRIT